MKIFSADLQKQSCARQAAVTDTRTAHQSLSSFSTSAVLRRASAGWLSLVQHQIEEHAIGHGTDDVILLAQSDQYVVDLVVEIEHAHGLDLGTHDLGVAGRSQLHVHAAAYAAHQHAAGAVHESATDGTVCGHQSVPENPG
jgi:hypothetical protein